MNNSENIVKDVFGWKVPVEQVPLPSGGVVYNPDGFLFNRETVQIKSMTAREEDILSSQAYIKEGTTIKMLVNSCLIDKNIEVNDLLLGDRNALMVAIRITGYGTDYKVKHRCPNCGTVNSIVVDLSGLPIKRFEVKPVEPGKNLFEYKLPVTKKTILYKYTNGHDEARDQIEAKRRKAIGISESVGSITKYLKDSIVSIDGIDDPLKIEHFIRNMPALDSRKLRLEIQRNEAGIDMSHDYCCENCSSENGFVLPSNTEFFWPST